MTRAELESANELRRELADVTSRLEVIKICASVTLKRRRRCKLKYQQYSPTSRYYFASRKIITSTDYQRENQAAKFFTQSVT